MSTKRCITLEIAKLIVYSIVPAALIEIDTPYSVEAMVLTALICDLVLGNIDGVSDTPDQ